jgi:hypothetical protein
MVLELLAAGLGFGAGTMLSNFLGDTKKGDTITTTESQTYHQPYETYSPNLQFAPQTSYAYQGGTYIINSPNATSKKDQSVSQESSPSNTPTWTQPQTYTQTPSVSESTGLSSNTLILIALIGAAAVVGYGFLSQ